jgi:hypothetical protein
MPLVVATQVMRSDVEGLFALQVQQPAFVTHYPVNPIVVDPVMSFQSQASPDADVTLGGTVLDFIGYCLLHNSVIAALGELFQVCPF